MNNLQSLSIYQPSLNQCLISKKYYSEAVPELGHLSLPPGFILKDYKNEIYYDFPISSTISDGIITKLVNKVDPNSNIEIIELNTINDSNRKTEKKSKKSRKKTNSKKKSKQTKKKNRTK